ncbi:MFS general substrate transporter [Mytilinidion resinicola]|uniref:MFS general substrate transporter n=1 Tax=Mytilinidion resinicola TaxID=574789 RepID=A0A6A6YES2_9PEZI|nr:MFS general substrate transporter [Mytilinidion resinicola]KAF2807322.1 MFS general substrate transporter [Mytilinidion resinicola]
MVSPNSLNHTDSKSVCCSVFLPNFEVTVVSTALVDISNNLRAFSRTGWVMVAYLTTYTGLIIIWAKLSDIIGRKVALTASLVAFTAFSAGCGAAQTITQLIVLRAFQGFGGAGCFSVASVIVFEMVPTQKYPFYGSIVSAVVALATLLGPIIGGLITENCSWRWVFLINVPIGVTTIIILLITLPNSFPCHSRKTAPMALQNSSLPNLRRMDFLGAFLFTGASFTFVTSLLESSTKYSWSSAPTIVLLVISVALAISFISWERYITLGSNMPEPIFPWRFVYNRAWMGMLLVSLLLGIPFCVLVVTIPQKLQTISDMSPLQSGLRLLPYALFAPFGAVFANGFISRQKNCVPVYFVIAGACFQLIGLSLFCIYGTGKEVSGAQYGCQILAGLGLGMMFGTLVVMTPLSVDLQDLATATGAIMQFRQFGSTIGLSVATSLMNAKLKSELPSILKPVQLEALLQSTTAIHQFPREVKLVVEEVFVEGYRLQMEVIIAFAGACVLVALIIFKKKQIKAPG